jgi:hypothetical protein
MKNLIYNLSAVVIQPKASSLWKVIVFENLLCWCYEFCKNCQPAL